MESYNTAREGIILKEYGRNVQKLVDYIRSLPTIEERTEMATKLIELIKQLAPVSKEGHENPQRMWDDLFIMADFNLDVNNPFNTPDPETIFKKPEKMEYPQSKLRYRHYGKNIERLVEEVLLKESEEERKDGIIYLGSLMKTFYGAWNKETLDDSVIAKDIATFSNGELKVDPELVKEGNLFEKIYVEKRKPRSGNDRPRGGGKFNKNRYRRQDR